ncbi:hypothetical protein EKK58_08555 [Candidatus Dependentiae bacterium]|nr:MAG: hypothetical protein EKK58_08555 [Candidatus Dependentiae bacterium]
MTNISTAFDAIKTLLATLYPQADGWIQLTDPYNIEGNSLSMHNKGWGVALGPGVNTNRQLECRLSVQRTISITLTGRRYANELHTENKEVAEKELLEAQFLLIQALEKEPQLNNSSSGITRFRYASDSGIENVIAGNDAFIKIVSDFELEYFEQLYT